MLTDPYVIFAQTRQYWEAARYPAQLSYTVVVTATRAGKPSVAHYHLYYDAVANHVSVRAVSDEEIAHPYTPHGINVIFSPFGGRIPLSSPEQTFDYLGVPVLAPNYSFGISTYVPHATYENSDELVAEIRREFHDPGPRRPASGLKTIANIDVVRRSYVISLIGLAEVDGHTDYELQLQPLRDPGRYRLRKVWVNALSFATDKLASQGNFTQGGMTGIPWTVSFRQAGNAPYIASESTSVPFTLDRRSYDSATVEFQDVTGARIPGIMQISSFAVNDWTGVPPLTEP